ncbi:large conductance mechanosensitive channel [Amphibacillus marinus]|uniref:Large-conductance mechanosensitive channel n=1 Tax=Amphibacillus marinus TaxID=872970 RepID=A0A1H8LCQ0_9BACI|nr:large-conductance mechanosensitive channel protein MscL [Amphibacillus marinus]SEO02911.1 large conductance mechanosensitive channel [Amphibacillus marinus]
MIKEFKAFIMRGNVIDLAVGLVMGAAFTAIVSALVENVITPIIVALTGKAEVSQLAFQLGSARIAYGFFLQAIIDFLLVALVLFLTIKGINKLARKKKEEEPEPAAPTAEQYLAEIRDLLAEQKADKQQ